MKPRMKPWTGAITAASVGFAMLATPVLAMSPEEARVTKQTEHVSYEGLDLATAEGQKLLEQRIEIAARRVCGFDNARTGTRLRPAGVYRCLAKARSSARTEVAALIEAQRRGG